jgi:hypothetical protein
MPSTKMKVRSLEYHDARATWCKDPSTFSIVTLSLVAHSITILSRTSIQHNIKQNVIFSIISNKTHRHSIQRPVILSAAYVECR